MKVYYGLSKLTEKMVRKPEIAIYFANTEHYNNDAWVEKRMLIVHTRYQTKGEIEDAKCANRMFTKYSIFPFDRPYFGDLEKALLVNFEADKNNVSANERELIRTKLRDKFYSFYNLPIPKKSKQLTMF